MNKKSVAYSTFVLTMVNIIVRILGFAYRIWLSRQLGAEGMGLYQLVFPVFSLVITLVSSGMPVAVSKMVAARPSSSNKVLKISKRIIFLASISIIVLCLTLASPITNYIIGDERALLAFIIMLPSILFIGLTTCYNGYFYGTKNVHPPALSELVEQLVRIIFVMLVFSLIPPVSSPIGAAIAMAGMMLGDLAGLICARLFYRRRVETMDLTSDSTIKQLLRIAVPITSIRIISSSIGTFTAIMLPKRLVQSGLEYAAALSQFGILMGMTFPLIYLPCTITSALAVVIIPNLTQTFTLGDFGGMRSKIIKALKLTTLVSFLFAPLLASAAEPLGTLLFQESLAGQLIKVLAPMVLFIGLQNISSSILHGINMERASLNNFLISSVFLVFSTIFLSALPSLRLYGYIIGLYASSIICAILNIMTITKAMKLKLPVLSMFILPALCSAITYFSEEWLYAQLCTRIESMVFRIVLTLIFGVIIFAVFGMLSGCVSFEKEK